MAMRIVWAKKSNTRGEERGVTYEGRGTRREARGDSGGSARPSDLVPRASHYPLHLRHARRHRQDDDPLQHLHHLLGDERVDGEAALRQRGEEERRQHDAERVVAPDEGDGDAEEAGAAGEAVLVVLLVA